MSLQRISYKSNKISSYFLKEWPVLVIVTVSGLLSSIGNLVPPWFEGRLTGMLVEVLKGTKGFSDMARLAAYYVVCILTVQLFRFLKRFYVRRFGNNINRSMKCTLYNNLLSKSKTELASEGAGTLLTKAISDVDDCAEGMRKFTTEIFDTGVSLLTYAGMLFYYDFRIAFLCMLFLPLSYFAAEKMKTVVQKTGAAYKKQAGILSDAIIERSDNVITYRVFGCDEERRSNFEDKLTDYEHSAVRANIWTGIMPSVYRVITMLGVIFIIYFGGRNVYGNGWKPWTIAIFTTFMSGFLKLAKKSASSAKLFNSVHRAAISWKRIKPLLNPVDEFKEAVVAKPGVLSVKNLSFSYPGGNRIIDDLSFTAKPGDIIGITGPVASGKSTLGKVFLCEYPYEGSITFNGRELLKMSKEELSGIIGYLGHDPELFSDTIEENVLLGKEADFECLIKAVRLDDEIKAMKDGKDTLIGDAGVRLSGGQAKRVALARTLAYCKPVMILDDPFSALYKKTEREIFEYLKRNYKDSIIFIISHRNYLFDRFDRVMDLHKHEK